MRVLDLFSGIGGFSLGLERAGMETVAFCENDKKARMVLRKHWPDIPIYEDVRELNGKHFEGKTIDLICGGFPCQPFSVAGKRGGADDDRHLWPEYFRLIQEIRPRWVLGENVAGLINMGLDQVLSDLESANYSCQTLIIPACAVNAPHRRDRVWIIAYSNSGMFRRIRCDEPADRQQYSGGGKAWGFPGAFCENVANTTSTRRQAGLSGSEQREKWDSRISLNSCHKSGGGKRENFWTVEPGMGRVANGVPGRVDRLKQLGNAVVPQVAEIIGRAIMEADYVHK